MTKMTKISGQFLISGQF